MIRTCDMSAIPTDDRLGVEEANTNAKPSEKLSSVYLLLVQTKTPDSLKNLRTNIICTCSELRNFLG